MRRPIAKGELGNVLSIRVIPECAKNYTMPRGFPLNPLEKANDAFIFLAILLSTGRTYLKPAGQRIEMFAAQITGEMRTLLVPDNRLDMLDPIGTAKNLVEGMLANNPIEPFNLTGSAYELASARLFQFAL